MPESDRPRLRIVRSNDDASPAAQSKSTYCLIQPITVGALTAMELELRGGEACRAYVTARVGQVILKDMAVEPYPLGEGVAFSLLGLSNSYEIDRTVWAELEKDGEALFERLSQGDYAIASDTVTTNLEEFDAFQLRSDTPFFKDWEDYLIFLL